MVRKGLLNRVLPAVLSAAMIFTSVPANTLAAEATPAVEAQAEETTDLAEEAPAEAEEAPAEAEEPAPAEEKPVVEQAAAEETEESFDAPEGGEAAAGEETEDVNEVTDPGARYYPEISVNVTTVMAAAGVPKDTYKETDEEPDGITYFVANPLTARNGARAIQEAVVANVNIVVDGQYMADVDDESNEAYKSELTYTWSYKSSLEATAFTDIENYDKVGATGVYRLAVTLNQHPDTEAVYFYLLVQKTNLRIVATGDYNGKTAGNPILLGTTVAEVKAEIGKYNLVYGPGAGTVVDKGVFVKQTAVTVRKTGTTEALADDYVIQYNEDYTIDITVTLNDAVSAGYEVENESYMAVLRDPIFTGPAFVLNNVDGATYVYDGKAIDKTVATNNLKESKIIYDKDDNGTLDSDAVLIESMVAAEADENNTTVTGYWAEWSDDLGEYVRWISNDPQMESPYEAGTYYYVMKYVDPNGTYAPYTYEAVVSIVPASVTVVPTGLKESSGLKADAIYEDTPMYEILRAVEYVVKDADGNEMDIDRAHFWGTVYAETNSFKPGAGGNFAEYDNYDSRQTTQSYAPVFEIKRTATEIAPKDGKDAEVKVEYYNLGNARDLTVTSKSEDGVYSYKYEIVFTGKKAVYSDNEQQLDFAPQDITDINSAASNSVEKNYHVETSKAVTEETAANVVELKLAAAKETTMDVTKVDNNLGLTFADPDVRQYETDENGIAKGLYEKKADYKKAIVTAAGTQIAADTDMTLFYTWEKLGSANGITNFDPADPVQNFTEAQVLEKLYEDEDEKNPKSPAELYGSETYVRPSDEEIAAMTQEEKEAEAKKYYAYKIWEKAWVNIGGQNDINGVGKDFNDVTTPTPFAPGVYRLHVTYYDSTHEYKTSEGYVYFTIQPAPVYVAFEGSPKAYDDGIESVGTWLEKVSPVSINADTKLSVKLYPGTLKDDGTVEKKSDTPIALGPKTDLALENNPAQFLYVQKKVDDTEGGYEWADQDSDDPLVKIQFIEPGTDNYRLVLDKNKINAYKLLATVDERTPDLSFYNFYGKAIGKHNQTLLTGADSDLASGTKMMTIARSEGKPIVITIDENAITDEVRFKTYNAQPFDQDKIAAAITLTDGEDGTVVKAADAGLSFRLYRWVDADPNKDNEIDLAELWNPFDAASDKPAPIEQVIHGGKYVLEVYVPTGAKYRTVDKKLMSYPFKINQKEYTIAPTLQEDIAAGQLVTGYDPTTVDGVKNRLNYKDGKEDKNYTANLLNNSIIKDWGEIKFADNTPVEGEADFIDMSAIQSCALVFEDDQAFENTWTVSTYAGKNLKIDAQVPVKSRPYTGYLKYGDTYYLSINKDSVQNSAYALRVDAFGHEVSYAADYQFQTVIVSFTPNKRGSGSVSVVNPSQMAITETIDNTNPSYVGHYVKPLAAIPVDPDTLELTNYRDRNYLELFIDMPKEFQDTDKAFDDENTIAWRTSLENSLKKIYEDSGIQLIDNEPGRAVDQDAEGNPYYDDMTGEKIKSRLYLYLDATAIKNMTPAEGSTAKAVSFDIAWDTDYIEHYTIDLTKSDLVVDLWSAVAPKKLAFNAAPKKLAVGESVQLDVKITRKEKSDIIFLGYESSDPLVVKVTDTTDAYGNYGGSGYITALKKGTATITVYPAKMVWDTEINDWVKKKIEGKGVKTAKVKIKVVDVDKVKISKVKAYDDALSFTYKKPKTGYRREYYVLEGNVSAKEAEKRVADVTNGDFSGFVFVDFPEDEKDAKGELAAAGKVVAASYFLGVTPKDETILKPQTQYTLYVRNVSGIRDLDRNGEVAVSVKGAVKKFKTSKGQVRELDAYADPYENYSENMYDFMTGTKGWRVLLSKKQTKIKVKGKFYQKYRYDDTHAIDKAADSLDYAWLDLPLKGADGKKYQKPKLNFFVVESNKPSATEPDKSEIKDYYKVVTGLGTEYYRKPKAAIATIGKTNGILKFKGEGVVYVLAVDLTTGANTVIPVFIDSDPTVIKAKNLKLQVGQTARLSSALTYKEKSLKDVLYQGVYTKEILEREMFSDLEATWEASDAFKVERVEKKQTRLAYDEEANCLVDETIYDYDITALKAGGKLSIKVNDTEVLKNTEGKGEVTVNVETKGLEPVKDLGLKVKDSSGIEMGFVYDNCVKGGFTHTLPYLNYKIELYNKKGEIVHSRVFSRKADGYDKKKKRYVYIWGYANPDDIGKYTVFDATSMSDYRLTDNKQNYRVSVTVLSGLTEDATTSKTASKKFKTTDIPASRRYSAVNWKNDKIKGLTGVDIRINTMKENATDKMGFVSGYSAGDTMPLTSGNTYTFEIADELMGGVPVTSDTCDADAKARHSDKLTWKVVDKKIAKIKATKDSYQARLTVLRPGKTEIQVKSKITKKLIASWFIYVSAVNDADSSYGVNEPYYNAASNDYEYSYNTPDGVEEKDILQVHLASPIVVNLKAFQRQWFVFEAPFDGEFAVQKNYVPDVVGDFSTYPISYETMFKGEKVYFSVSNWTGVDDVARFVEVVGKEFHKITTDGTNRILAGDSFIFTAPEDNVYYFSFIGDDGEKYYFTDDNGGVSVLKSVVDNDIKSLALGQDVRIPLWIGIDTDPSPNKKNIITTANKEYPITVEYRKPVELTEAAPGAYDLADEDAENWFVFTAPEDATYTFANEGSDGKLTMFGVLDPQNAYYYDNNFYDELDSLSTTVPHNIITNTYADDHVVNGNYCSYYEAGKKVYFCASSTLATADNHVKGKITVTKQAEQTFEVGADKAVTVNVPSKSQSIYNFVPTENGVYKLKFNTRAGTIINIVGEKTVDGEKTYTPVGNLSLAGDAASFVVDGKYNRYKIIVSNAMNDPDETTTMVLTKRTYIDLAPYSEKAEEAQETDIEEGGELFYRFVVPDKKYTGQYEIEFTGSDALEVFDLLNENETDENEYNSWVAGVEKDIDDYYDADGVKVPLVRYFCVKSAVAAKIKSSYKEVTSTVIPVGKLSDEVTWTKDDADDKIFTFTIPENNYYTFTFTSTPPTADASALTISYKYRTQAGVDVDVDPIAPDWHDTDTTTKAYTWKYSTYLRKGDGTITFEVTGTPTKPATITATAEKRTTTAFTVGDTGNAVSVPAESSVWYTFKADELAIYDFDFMTETSGKSLDYTVYTDETLADTVYGFNPLNVAQGTDKKVHDNSYINTPLHKLKTLYIEAYNADAAAVTGKVTITKKSVGTIKAGEKTEFTLTKDNDEAWYSFEAPTNEAYYVVIKADDKLKVVDTSRRTSLIGGLTGPNSTNADGRYTYTIGKNAARKTWFKFTANNPADIDADDEQLKGSITITRVPTVYIDGTTASWSIGYDNPNSQNFVFTAPSTGFYKFEFATDSGNSYDLALSGDDVESDGGNTPEGKKKDYTRFLVYGAEHTFTVRDTAGIVDAAEKTFAGTITITKRATTPIGALGTETAYSLTKDNKEAYYTYTVKSTGLYKFTMAPTEEKATFTIWKQTNSTLAPAPLAGGTVDKESKKSLKSRYFLFEKGDMLTVEVDWAATDDTKTSAGSFTITEGTLNPIPALDTDVSISIDGMEEVWYYYSFRDTVRYDIYGMSMSENTGFDAKVLAGGHYGAYGGWGVLDNDKNFHDYTNGITAGTYMLFRFYSAAATDEAPVTGKVRITAPKDAELDKEESFTVGKTIPLVYNFEAEEDGFYTFTMTRTGTAEITANLADGAYTETQATAGDTKSVKYTRWMNKGNKAAITLIGAGTLEEGQTTGGTLKITKIADPMKEFPELTANTGATEVKTNAYSVRYFSFKPDINTDYALNVTTTASKGTLTTSVLKYDIANKKWMAGSLINAKPGEKFIIAARSTTAEDVDQKIWIKRAKITLGDSVFVGAPSDGAPTPGMFSFTAEEAGLYRLTISLREGKNAFTVSGNAVTAENPYTDVRKLDEDDVLLINLGGSYTIVTGADTEGLGVVEGTITVEKVTVPALPETAISIPPAAGEMWYTYTTSTEGFYEFTADNFGYAVDSKVWWIDTNGNWSEIGSASISVAAGAKDTKAVYIPAGTLLYVYVKNNGTPGVANEGKYTIKKAEEAELTPGATPVSWKDKTIGDVLYFRARIPASYSGKEYKLVLTPNHTNSVTVNTVYISEADLATEIGLDYVHDNVDYVLNDTTDHKTRESAPIAALGTKGNYFIRLTIDATTAAEGTFALVAVPAP